MAKKENQHNDYRAERKKRLAKAAKKTKKSTVDSVKLVTWIVRIVSILAVLGLVVFGLYQFGVPHKFLPALEVNGRTYSVAEFNFYYTSVYNSYSEQAQSQMSTYGYATFDYTKDPSYQTYTDADGNKMTYAELFKKEAIKTIETTNYYLNKCNEEGIVLSEESKAQIDTIIQSLYTQTATSGYSVSRYISLVYGKGLNEKMFKELLEEQFLVSQYTETIEEDFYNNITDEDLEKAYAEDPSKFQCVDLRLFGFEIAAYEDSKESTETTTTATETTTTETETTTVAEDTTAASEEETTAAPEEKEPSKAELLAQEMLDKITSEQSFIDLAYEYSAEEDKETFKNDTATLAKSIKKSVVTSDISEDLAVWLYDSSRTAGEKTICVTDKYVYVIYIINPVYRVDTPLVDARHILISFDSMATKLKNTEGNTIVTDKKDDAEIKTETVEDGAPIEITNEGTGYSIELVVETYKEARNIYDKYYSEGVANGKTEEYFAELADKYSADTNSTNGNGGLYEGIEKGEMVEAFDNWVYDPDRKTGDVDVIMTEYGWHVIYFVKTHDEPAWKADARNTLGTEAFENYNTTVENEVSGTAKTKAFFNFGCSEALKLITDLY